MLHVVLCVRYGGVVVFKRGEAVEKRRGVGVVTLRADHGKWKLKEYSSSK